MSAAIEVGSVDPAAPSANQIRKELSCAPERARDLRDELVQFGGVPSLNGHH